MYGAKLIGVILTALLLPAAVGASEGPSVGGWLGFVAADNDKAGTKPYFDAHPWYFQISGEPADDWRFLGEIEAEHVFRFKAGKDGAGELKLERLYIEHNFSTAVNVRAGKFNLPFGYWYRLHWHFLTETLSRPLSFANSYAPKFQVGLQLWGRLFLGDMSRLDYYAWVGDGPDQFGTNKRTVKQPAAGAAVFAQHELNNGMEMGVSAAYHHQRTNDGIREDNDDFTAGVRLDLIHAEIRGEYFLHRRSESADLTTLYGTLTLYPFMAWERDDWALSYRVDMGDDIKTAGGATDSSTTSHSSAILWRPHAAVLAKAEYRTRLFADDAIETFNEWNMFLGMKY